MATEEDIIALVAELQQLQDQVKEKNEFGLARGSADALTTSEYEPSVVLHSRKLDQFREKPQKSW